MICKSRLQIGFYKGLLSLQGSLQMIFYKDWPNFHKSTLDGLFSKLTRCAKAGVRLRTLKVVPVYKKFNFLLKTDLICKKIDFLLFFIGFYLQKALPINAKNAFFSTTIVHVVLKHAGETALLGRKVGVKVENSGASRARWRGP